MLQTLGSSSSVEGVTGAHFLPRLDLMVATGWQIRVWGLVISLVAVSVCVGCRLNLREMVLNLSFLIQQWRKFGFFYKKEKIGCLGRVL